MVTVSIIALGIHSLSSRRFVTLLSVMLLFTLFNLLLTALSPRILLGIAIVLLEFIFFHSGYVFDAQLFINLPPHFPQLHQPFAQVGEFEMCSILRIRVLLLLIVEIYPFEVFRIYIVYVGVHTLCIPLIYLIAVHVI